MRIAKDGGYLGMATGESMGQVSSQTLHNLYASSLGIDMPIYRPPLVGFDKSEITMLARRLGPMRNQLNQSRLASYYQGSPGQRLLLN